MRHLSTVLLCILCLGAFAQKPNINKAKAALDKGELAEAKTIIDKAISYEKTMGKAKTWYYRGMVYMALDTTNSEPGALATSLESYRKALEIDPDQKTINVFDPLQGGIVNVDSKLQQYFAHYYNIGIGHYQEDEYALATDNFEKATLIKPEDTSSYINAAYAATAAEDDERAKKNFEKAIEAGAKDKIAYLRLYNFDVQEDDKEGALAIIQKAREVYPNDLELSKYEINILIQLDQIDEAKESIKEAIKKDTDNADLHFSLGVIHEELEEFVAALENYQNAIKADENHFNSNFNIGVMLFNKSTELIKERNNLGYKENKKYNELSNQINERLNEALPVWEKLYSLKNTDQTVLETLKYIYANLDMVDKAEKIANEIEQLGN